MKRRNPRIRTLRATLPERFALAKRQLERDFRSGKIPKSVCSFEELADYVDANEYGGWSLDSEKWGYRGPGDIPSVVAFQGAITDYLRRRGSRKKRRNPTIEREFAGSHGSRWKISGEAGTPFPADVYQKIGGTWFHESRVPGYPNNISRSDFQKVIRNWRKK